MNLTQKRRLIEKVSVFEDIYSDLPEDIERKYFYPLYSDILPNGHLSMNTSGISKSGERWDGREVITSNHPMYHEWKTIIEQKEYYVQIQQDIWRAEKENCRSMKRGDNTTNEVCSNVRQQGRT